MEFAEVGEAVGAAVVGAVGALVGDVVGEAVGEAVGAAVGAAVGDEVGEAVGEAVGAAVGDKVGEAVGEAVGAAVQCSIQLSSESAWQPDPQVVPASKRLRGRRQSSTTVPSAAAPRSWALVASELLGSPATMTRASHHDLASVHDPLQPAARAPPLASAVTPLPMDGL